MATLPLQLNILRCATSSLFFLEFLINQQPATRNRNCGRSEERCFRLGIVEAIGICRRNEIFDFHLFYFRISKEIKKRKRRKNKNQEEKEEKEEEEEGKGVATKMHVFVDKGKKRKCSERDRSVVDTA